MDTYQVIWIRDSVGIGSGAQHPVESSIRYLPPGQAIPAITQCNCAAVVLECPIVGWTTAELLEEVQRARPEVQVLIRDLGISLHEAVRLARLGAHRFLPADEDPFLVLEQVIEEH